jgi:hypothetical protein
MNIIFTGDSSNNTKISVVPISQTLSTLTNGLCAFYNFDGNINDSSGNGKNLGGAYIADTGKVGSQCVTFNTFGTCGSGPGVYYNGNLWNSYTGTAASNYSVSFWFKPKVNVNPGGCLGGILGSFFGTMGFGSYYYTTNKIALVFPVSWSADVAIKDPDLQILNTWNHYVLTHDAVSKIVTGYKNGALMGRGVYTATARNRNGWTGFCINGSGGGYNPPREYGVPCSFDAVGLWNRVLNEQEVSLLTNNGNGMQFPFSSGYSNNNAKITL